MSFSPGPDPPGYAPVHTIKAVKTWAIYHLTAFKPALPRDALTTGEARLKADVAEAVDVGGSIPRAQRCPA